MLETLVGPTPTIGLVRIRPHWFKGRISSNKIFLETPKTENQPIRSIVYTQKTKII